MGDKKYKEGVFICNMCEDTECTLEFKSKDHTTNPNRCPHWMGIAKWKYQSDLET